MRNYENKYKVTVINIVHGNVNCSRTRLRFVPENERIATENSQFGAPEVRLLSIRECGTGQILLFSRSQG